MRTMGGLMFIDKKNVLLHTIKYRIGIRLKLGLNKSGLSPLYLVQTCKKSFKHDTPIII